MTPDQRFDALARAIRDRRKTGNDKGLDPSCLEILLLYIDVADDTGAAALSTTMMASATGMDERTARCCRQHLTARGHLIDTGTMKGRIPVFRVMGGKTDPGSNGPPQVSETRGAIPPPIAPRTAQKPKPSRRIEARRAPKTEGGHSTRGGLSTSSLSLSGKTPTTEYVTSIPSPPELPSTRVDPPPSVPKRGSPPTAHEIETFERFYRAHPKRKGHDAALRAWVTRCRKGDDPEAMIRAAQIWGDAFDRECQRLAPLAPGECNAILYEMKTPENWLREGEFNDPPSIPTVRVERARTADRIRHERSQPQPVNGRMPERKAGAPSVGSPEWHKRNRDLGLA